MENTYFGLKKKKKKTGYINECLMVFSVLINGNFFGFKKYLKKMLEKILMC
jgi:hypothetical protein